MPDQPALPHAHAIEVRDLSRVYDTTVGVFRRSRRQITALSHVSFSIAPGELFGLVGPNGAGKSTLIKILTTLLLPTQGSATVLGLDVARDERQLRQHINVVFGGERGLYTRLSAEDNLKYFADLYRVPRSVAAQRIPALLDLVGLREREKERVEGYSKGMKQRLHIAKALINEPKVLFLDEPTLGLDVAAARKLREIVQHLQSLGITIILTSHYMYEVDTLCQRVAIINKGELLAIDSPYNLKRYVAKLFVVEAQMVDGVLDEQAITSLKEISSVENIMLTMSAQFQTLTIHTPDPDCIMEQLRQRFPAQKIAYLITREPTLEDAYIKLIGSEL